MIFAVSIILFHFSECISSTIYNIYNVNIYPFAKYPATGLASICTRAFDDNIHPILLFSEVAKLNESCSSFRVKLISEWFKLGLFVTTSKLMLVDWLWCRLKQSFIVCWSCVTSISGIIGTANVQCNFPNF